MSRVPSIDRSVIAGRPSTCTAATGSAAATANHAVVRGGRDAATVNRAIIAETVTAEEAIPRHSVTVATAAGKRRRHHRAAAAATAGTDPEVTKKKGRGPRVTAVSSQSAGVDRAAVKDMRGNISSGLAAVPASVTDRQAANATTARSWRRRVRGWDMNTHAPPTPPASPASDGILALSMPTAVPSPRPTARQRIVPRSRPSHTSDDLGRQPAGPKPGTASARPVGRGR